MRDQERGGAFSIATGAAVDLGNEIVDLPRDSIGALQFQPIGHGELQAANRRLDRQLVGQVKRHERGDPSLTGTGQLPATNQNHLIRDEAFFLPPEEANAGRSLLIHGE